MKPGSVDFPQRHEAAILIVDDAPANLELLRKSMSEQGYQTYVATSGERALTIAQRAQPGKKVKPTLTTLAPSAGVANLPVVKLPPAGTATSVGAPPFSAR